MKPTQFNYLSEESAPYLRYTDFAGSPLNRNRLSCIVGMLEACEATESIHSILEVGCGIGNICIPLASLGYDVKAIDIDGASTEIMLWKNPFDNLRVETLAVEDEDVGSYDVIVLTEVLEHVPNAEDFFRNIVRRMRPGTWMILTVPKGYGLCELVLRPGYSLKRSGKGLEMIKIIRRMLGTRELTTANVQTPHLHFFTLKRINGFFERNHLQLISFHSIFFLWVLLESLFSANRLPASMARWDYLLSQKLAPAFCANWIFLQKTE